MLFVYLKKIINTFLTPTFLYSLLINVHPSPNEISNKKNFFNKIFLKLFFFYPRYLYDTKGWIDADINSYRNINDFKELRIGVDDIFIKKIKELSNTESEILDLGCGIGRHLNCLKKGNYTNLTGVDIMSEIKSNHFDLSGIKLHHMFLQEFLKNNNKKFDIIYSVGAVIEIIHPSFDIIKYMCKSSKNYICLLVQQNCHYFPRFYEYEFKRNGFDIFYKKKNLNKPRLNREKIDMLIFKKI